MKFDQVRPFSSGDAPFEATRWSVVLAAKGDAAAARAALEVLCQIYWYPLYAFVRRQGCGAHEAQDLTQELDNGQDTFAQKRACVPDTQAVG